MSEENVVERSDLEAMLKREFNQPGLAINFLAKLIEGIVERHYLDSSSMAFRSIAKMFNGLADKEEGRLNL